MQCDVEIVKKAWRCLFRFCIDATGDDSEP